MTMVRQYPPQPQPPLLSPLGPYQQPQPSPSHRQLLRNAPGFDQPAVAQQPLPQQYAHPLSRHNSYHSQGSDSGRTTAKPPEHMLRRKTPNGILAAAYDGTSVEQTEKPHATKHILLPVTADSGLPYGLKQELPLRSPAHNEFGQLKADATSDWSPSLYFETGSGRAGGQYALPQIDSMLNQITPLQPHPHYPMYGNQFGAAPEPPLQSQLGPTVSNDQGPYGPYWPNGTFIPYRPAALRDPRFYSHHTPNWSHSQHNAFLGHAYNSSIPNINVQHNQYQLQQPQNAYGNIGRPSIEYPPPYPQSQHNPALDYQNQPLPLPQSQRPQPDFSLSSSGQSTPIADQTPSSTPLSEFGPQSINAQTREKVFAWAHSVYVDLLKYLQSTRKPSLHQHSNGQQPTRPHIYPKPPRQPAASFTSSASNSATPTLDRPDASQMGQSQLNRDTFQRPAHHRSSASWSISGADPNLMRQPWYPVQSQPFANPHAVQPQVSGMEPPRPLRRMSGSVATVHQTLRHDIPPSMTAASALDAITKHCEDSKWSWVDGILLGGCLAYALGDYQKAQEWYKHILTLDRE